MIEDQWKSKERPKLVPTEEQEDFFYTKDISNEKYEELLLQTNPTKTEQLNEALDIFYSNQMTQRQAALKKIHKTVKVMMSTSKQESSA
jgi:adenine-specific DNA methylase